MLLEAKTRPMFTSGLVPYLDLGAIRFVSDFLIGDTDTPDCTQWVSGCTDDTAHWHFQADTRDFIAFSITPRVGRILRSAVNVGTVEVLVECDGNRHEDVCRAVTATLKGKSDKEF